MYIELHMSVLHIKYMYTSFVSCGCREEEFFMYFHYYYKSVVDNGMPGAWPVWTPGTPLAGFIKRSSTQNMKALGHVVSEKKIIFMFYQL